MFTFEFRAFRAAIGLHPNRASKPRSDWTDFEVANEFSF